MGRLVDTIMAFPLFVLAMGIVAALGNSVGNIVYELDGCSALELYKRYLGEHATQLPASLPIRLQCSSASAPALNVEKTGLAMSLGPEI